MTAHITRTSILTNQKRTLQLPQYTPEQLEKKLLAYNNGHLLLEEAFPELSYKAREFIKNGTIEKEWDEYLRGNKINTIITDEHWPTSYQSSLTVDNTSDTVEYIRMKQLIINPILAETTNYCAIIRGYLNPSLLNVVDVRSCWIAFFARFRQISLDAEQISLDFYVHRGYDWL